MCISNNSKYILRATFDCLYGCAFAYVLTLLALDCILYS